jgi:hypothetical protein
MPTRTDAQLTTDANVIKNETAPGANTATRVGNMLIDLIDSKANLNDLASPSAVGVAKLYNTYGSNTDGAMTQSQASGRDPDWVTLTLTTTSFENQSGTNPTSASGHIRYRRLQKETFLDIRFVITFAATPTEVYINNLPSILDTILTNGLNGFFSAHINGFVGSSVSGINFDNTGQGYRVSANKLFINPGQAGTWLTNQNIVGRFNCILQE